MSTTDHKYAVKVKLLERFYALYREGRKNGAPQNFIDYFKASTYLINEVENALTSQKNEIREKVRGMKLDPNPDADVYNAVIDDILALLADNKEV